MDDRVVGYLILQKQQLPEYPSLQQVLEDDTFQYAGGIRIVPLTIKSPDVYQHVIRENEVILGIVPACCGCAKWKEE